MPLSFYVKEVKVDVGEAVSLGQVLATLDDQTFRLNVEAVTATVGRAEVELADADRKSDRLQQIAKRDRGLVSRQMLDQAQTNAEAARKQLSYTRSRLNLAQRDLDRTVLRAPFDGVVTERHVDPFQEIDRGQPLFDLHAEGAMEAAISIPESEIKQVYLGLAGEIRLPAIPGQTYTGIVTEIAGGDHRSLCQRRVRAHRRGEHRPDQRGLLDVRDACGRPRPARPAP